MAEKPILFSGPMVRAILEGRKTQTRRVVKNWNGVNVLGEDGSGVLWERCPYGKPGDRLWVRETHLILGDGDVKTLVYKADGWTSDPNGPWEARWRPSIHMPRWASRITLEITDVRVERVQDISEEDAVAEGAALVSPDTTGTMASFSTYRNAFRCLWHNINASRGYGWDINPWVWCVSFRVMEAD